MSNWLIYKFISLMPSLFNNDRSMYIFFENFLYFLSDFFSIFVWNVLLDIFHLIFFNVLCELWFIVNLCFQQRAFSGIYATHVWKFDFILVFQRKDCGLHVDFHVLQWLMDKFVVLCVVILSKIIIRNKTLWTSGILWLWNVTFLFLHLKFHYCP